VKLRRGARRPRVKNVDDQMTFTEHLGELRDRLIKSILAIGAGAIIVFLFYDPILTFLGGPYEDFCRATPDQCSLGGDFIITGPLDGFGIRLKVAGWGGLALALPVVLWQLWRFITPGLHPKEKKYAVPFILSAVVLFFLGAAVAYWTLPKALDFLISFSGSSVTSAFTPNSYISFIVLMMAAFGISFLFPVLLVFLELAGVVTPKTLSGFRRYAWVIIVIFAAVITPSGDPYSMLALAVPMVVFYELSILIGRLIMRSRAKAEARAAASSTTA
jgi:sec-independent protein translocase protein TatC